MTELRFRVPFTVAVAPSNDVAVAVDWEVTVRFTPESEPIVAVEVAFVVVIVRLPPVTSPKVTPPANSVAPEPVRVPMLAVDRKRRRPLLETSPSNAGFEN